MNHTFLCLAAVLSVRVDHTPGRVSGRSHAAVDIEEAAAGKESISRTRTGIDVRIKQGSSRTSETPRGSLDLNLRTPTTWATRQPGSVDSCQALVPFVLAPFPSTPSAPPPRVHAPFRFLAFAFAFASASLARVCHLRLSLDYRRLGVCLRAAYFLFPLSSRACGRLV